MLAPNYEIRVLGPEHVSWATAIFMHGTMFDSPVWSLLYAEAKTKRTYALYESALDFVAHQISSGLSLGVFDKDYKFHYEDSAATGGKLHWDLSDEAADGDKLLRQMDFPLVSIALAHDRFHTVEPADVDPILAVLPKLGVTLQALKKNDRGEPVDLEATAAGQVILRNGTNTRADYQGKGLMKALAHYMMLDAAEKGWQGLRIECAADAVTHVWTNPPAPFKSQIVSELDTWTYEETDQETRQKTHPLRPAKQRVVKVRVYLS